MDKIKCHCKNFIIAYIYFVYTKLGGEGSRYSSVNMHN